jgi:hypothetical protein
MASFMVELMSFSNDTASVAEDSGLAYKGLEE